jgi:D-tyrosyl-tRNA(Tyr) deacylase
VRALVQRVSRAAVTVAGEEVAAIGPGLLVLLGITHDDDGEVADRMAAKLRALRIFPDADGRMNEPLGEREVLCVSQFTLYGDTRRATGPPTSPPPARSTPSRSTSASARRSARPAGASAPTWRSRSSTTGR